MGKYYLKNKEKRRKYHSYYKSINIDKIRERDKLYQRNRRATHKKLKTREYINYCRKYPEKVYAQQLLNRYIKSGKIQRSPCEVCGETERIHGHHPDYSKPLEVIWLCPLHHKGIHQLKDNNYKIWLKNKKIDGMKIQ
jgi:hypothetical protein